MVAHPAFKEIAMTSQLSQRTTFIWLAVFMFGAFALTAMLMLGSGMPLPASAVLQLPMASRADTTSVAPAAATAEPGATGASDAADSESNNAMGNVPAGS